MTTLIVPINDLDLQIIESLDFKFDPPCEYPGHSEQPRWHDGPAFYIISVHKACGCPSKAGNPFLLCKKGYEDPFPVLCFYCERMYEKNEIWHAVGTV